LINPDNSSPFYLATDASDVGMGAFLLQKRDAELRPIHFASKRLSTSHRKYSASQRERLAMIWESKDSTIVSMEESLLG